MNFTYAELYINYTPQDQQLLHLHNWNCVFDHISVTFILLAFEDHCPLCFKEILNMSEIMWYFLSELGLFYLA